MTWDRLAKLALVAALAVVAQAGGARATSFTWDTTDSATSSGGTLGPYTSNGQSIYAVGYRITGGTTAAAKMADTLMPATAVEFTGTTGGIGVVDSSETNASPANPISNQGRSGGQQITDMVAFALPGLGYYPTSITLHQFCANGLASGAQTCVPAGSTGFDDVSIFVGGNPANMPTGATTLAQLVSTYGFTQITTANLVTGSSLTGSGDRTINLTGTLPGAYLIIAASLNDNAGTPDYFKVAALSANKVAEPGTLAILAVGIAGVAVARRRHPSGTA
ncbi:MAG: hypothetical protein JWL84_5171 [Rhodospirillales bacterium]|nr:hypothetical protein [Rhodospirillales bacterium]